MNTPTRGCYFCGQALDVDSQWSFIGHNTPPRDKPRTCSRCESEHKRLREGEERKR